MHKNGNALTLPVVELAGQAVLDSVKLQKLSLEGVYAVSIGPMETFFLL